jgi:flavin reductase (DIM6/NTAB) family NADH-FMN oxidoreductase RutF
VRPEFGQERFKEAMAAVPTGVAVVSTGGAGGFRALAASSFTSASLEPPLVLVCLDSLSQTREAVAETAAFNLSVLERGQEFLAERFSGRAPLIDPSWREVPHRLGGNGLPIVEGCVAWFECRLHQLYAAGDHDVALGEVIDAGRGAGEPLILWDRAFWRLG